MFSIIFTTASCKELVKSFIAFISSSLFDKSLVYCCSALCLFCSFSSFTFFFASFPKFKNDAAIPIPEVMILVPLSQFPILNFPLNKSTKPPKLVIPEPVIVLPNFCIPPIILPIDCTLLLPVIVPN